MRNQEENWSLFRLSDRKQFDNVSLATIDFFFRALSDSMRADWLMWRDGFSGWRPLSELSSILKHLQSGESSVPTPPPVPDAVLKFAEEVTGVTGVTGLRPSSSVILSQDSLQTDVKSIEITAIEEVPPVDDEVSKPHSSVSSRAITAATSSLRLKTLTSVPALKTPAPITKALNENGKVFGLENEATLSLMLESQAASEDRNNVRYQKKFKARITTPNGILNVFTIDCSSSGFRLKDPLPAGMPRFFHVELDLGPEGKIPLVCSEIREKDGRGATRLRIQVNDHINTLKSALVRAA